ncbi:MAG: hypothetical protein HY046_00585 [Acidobacteria bacterium]|nr:hypothetical protein [Acidobacteriota bacterium]
MYTCRECERPINQATEICPYCGADLTATGIPGVADPSPPAKGSGWKMALRLAIPIAAMWGFLWYVLPERAGNASAQAETKALAAIREVAGVLENYVQAQRSYPTSLEMLGEKARKPAQLAQSEGYHLEYTAGNTTDEGTVRTFVLLGRAGNYGYRNFFVDQTGTIRATRENRAATAEDPPI